MNDFPKVEGYYSTLFHEFIHSTGHSSRLKRDGNTSATVNFGSEEYSKEELVAEIGASIKIYEDEEVITLAMVRNLIETI